MSPGVQALQQWFSQLGVPGGLVPLFPFLLGTAIVYAMFAMVLYIGVNRFHWIAPRTASFLAFISPWIFGFLVFLLGPMGYSLYLSMTQWNMLSPPHWIGLTNYLQIFHDPMFYKALEVSLYYTLVGVPLQVALSFLIGLLMNTQVRGIYYFRAIYYLPSLVSGVAQTVFFIWVFNPTFGLMNGVLHLFGISGPTWFLSPTWAMPGAIIMSLWVVGGNMVIYLAGLQDIPATLYEAADLDGAGWLAKFWQITVPQMSPILFFNLVTGVIGGLQTFTQGYLITGSSGTGGGPNNSLLFFVYYLYERAFYWMQMGYAAALAWVLFIIIMVLTVIIFKSSAVWVYYETEQIGGERPRAR